MNFKNLWLFYVVLAIPMIVLFMLIRSQAINSIFAVVWLGTYFLLYSPIITGLRLLQSSKIRKSELLYNFIPGWNAKFIGFLFFEIEL